VAFEEILPEEEAYIGYASINFILLVKQRSYTSFFFFFSFFDESYLQVVARKFSLPLTKFPTFLIHGVYYNALSYDHFDEDLKQDQSHIMT